VIACSARRIEAATKELRKNPRDRLALRDYDFALSRVFSIIRDAHLDAWTHPLHVLAPGGGEYVLTQRPAANPLWKPQEFDLIPADELAYLCQRRASAERGERGGNKNMSLTSLNP
jgi:hypothetical protein